METLFGLFGMLILGCVSSMVLVFVEYIARQINPKPEKAFTAKNKDKLDALLVEEFKKCIKSDKLNLDDKHVMWMLLKNASSSKEGFDGESLQTLSEVL